MDNEYVLIYTPYITRKGVRIWASQYGLKVFCLRIPREKLSRLTLTRTCSGTGPCFRNQ